MTTIFRTFNTLRLAIAVALLGALLIPGAAISQGTLFVKNDRVGIGTSNPQVRLHIRENDGTARIRVQELKTGTSLLGDFRNSGNIRMHYRPGRTWRTEYRNGEIQWNLLGGGARAGLEMRLRTNGDLRIKGTLSQGSSRTLKQGIQAVEPRDVLERLLWLPVAEWSYKNDRAASRHIGPMAESFHAAFGLGEDNQHLAPADTAGVALAAVQGMYQIVQEKGERIGALEAENAALAKRLARLEEALLPLPGPGLDSTASALGATGR